MFAVFSVKAITTLFLWVSYSIETNRTNRSRRRGRWARGGGSRPSRGTHGGRKANQCRGSSCWGRGGGRATERRWGGGGNPGRDQASGLSQNQLHLPQELGSCDHQARSGGGMCPVHMIASVHSLLMDGSLLADVSALPWLPQSGHPRSSAWAEFPPSWLGDLWPHSEHQRHLLESEQHQGEILVLIEC